MKVKERFWFHYNKPASKAAGRNVLTLHCRGRCYLVHSIDCRVPIVTRDRNQQPRCVMAGCGVVSITRHHAVIE